MSIDCSFPAPPVARRIPQVLGIHGDLRRDDYSWLRDKDAPEVLAYLRAESAFADAMMQPTHSLQEELYREMVGRIKEDDSSVPFRRGAHLYYSRTEKGKQYPIMCRKALAPDAVEEVTLDLNALAAGHPFFSLGAFTVSDDANRLAYSTDVTGFREYTLVTRDLRDGSEAAERVPCVSGVAWGADPGEVFYVAEDEAKRPYRLYRHRLGTPVAADALIYEEVDALFRLHVWRSRSRAYLFAMSRSFTSAEVRYVRADRPAGAWALVAPREKDHEYDIDHRGDLFYIRTNAGGMRNFRVVTAEVADPRPERWTELIAHRDEVMLDDVEMFAEHCVIHEREDGLVRLHVTDLESGATHHIAFPEPAYEVESEANVEFSAATYRFRYESLVTPASVFDYDVRARTRALLKQTEVLGGYDPAAYRSERVYATAPDGVRIPISVVCRRETPRDGTAPMILAGYGAYGIPYPVTFSSSRLSLLDRGLTVAIAHVRGGGEMGKRWHDAGRMMAKRNSFTDFVAAADFLAKVGYTAADRLAIEGGSAGGLLVGAVLNLRPDLCRIAVLRVPFLDVINTMLDESLPLTVGEFEEWGNPKILEHYAYMATYCPYSNLRPVAYPAMLVRTSLNDSQVMYWEPAKYVAKLRAIRPDDTPLLLKINMDAGHGGASGRYDFLREIAYDYAFVLAGLGCTDVALAADEAAVAGGPVASLGGSARRRADAR
ncbi:MAG TPA: S9 family peptidase [Candidatus Binatia bacterium]|nr:S9 family peptidase [Candidatus Binatia bacterium]